MGRLSAWGPVVVWCGLIFYFSSIPDLRTPLSCDYPLRKLAHLCEYAVLALLLRRAGVGPVKAFAFCVAYAASDEWHQSFVPGRAGAVSDVVVDGAGALTGLLARGILTK